MNRNSLEDFLAEAKALKVPGEMIEEVKRQMGLEISPIELFGQIPADKGVMDLTLHLNKSKMSDFYYFNKFELAHSKGEPLAEGIQYFMVKAPEEGLDKPKFLPFESEAKALEFFKTFKGTAELAIGKPTEKDYDFRLTVATMKEGKVDYLNREFELAYKIPVLKTSVFVNKGKGFSVVQAVNMLQGRSVFRGDLVNREGEGYKAWSTYLVNEPRDNYKNYKIKQSGYNFDVKDKLAEYDIKELKDEKLCEKMIGELQDGSRAKIHLTDPEGEKRTLLVEAVPRYLNLNFYGMDGKAVFREQLKKEVELDQGNLIERKQEKGKGQSKDQDMGI